MLQENLQINIGANTQDLQAGLNQATNSVNNFSASVQKAAKPTADATNTLGNLSRVAQDAPYGFMGIANNLNPLLESFQRLQKESGGAGNALKALASGLTGPAGIGLALGVVSSLIVKYGDEIGDMIVKTTDFEKAQQGIRTAFFDSLKTVEATIATDKALVSVISDVTQSTEARKRALNDLKEAHKGNVELQKADITDGALLVQIIDRLSEALIRKAKIEATSKIIGEEYAKLIKLQMATVQEQVGNLSGLAKTWDVLTGSVKGALGGTGAMEIGLKLTNDGLKNNEKQVTNTKDSIEKLKESLKSLTGEAYKSGDFDVIGKAAKPATVNKESDTALQKRIVETERLIKLDMDLANQQMNNQYKADTASALDNFGRQRLAAEGAANEYNWSNQVAKDNYISEGISNLGQTLTEFGQQKNTAAMNAVGLKILNEAFPNYYFDANTINQITSGVKPAPQVLGSSPYCSTNLSAKYFLVSASDRA